jgi:hypothetical protein
VERELRELDLDAVVIPQFLNTPGTEIAPRSDEIGKDFENQSLGHNASGNSPYARNAGSDKAFRLKILEFRPI